MNVLGLDMSSKKSGYSLFNNEKLIDYGLWEISFKDEKDWRERIIFMANQLENYIKTHDIEQVFVEDVPPVLENSQTIKVLSALQGCVLTICKLNNIKVKFVPNNTWKNIVGIDMAHSKENKAQQKKLKLIDKKCLGKLKQKVKAYEKKLSVDYANDLFGLDLVWKSETSKYNQDDISDSINIVVSQLFKNVHKYNLDTFDNIIETLYQEIKQKESRGFGNQSKLK